MRKLICRLIGHRFNLHSSDSSYPVCGRCGFHSYYDFEEWLYKRPILLIPYYILYRLFWNIIKRFGKRKDELPF